MSQILEYRAAASQLKSYGTKKYRTLKWTMELNFIGLSFIGVRSRPLKLDRSLIFSEFLYVFKFKFEFKYKFVILTDLFTSALTVLLLLQIF